MDTREFLQKHIDTYRDKLNKIKDEAFRARSIPVPESGYKLFRELKKSGLRAKDARKQVWSLIAQGRP